MNSTSQENDEKKTNYLKALGFEIIRFENKMVFENLYVVLQEKREHFK